MKRSERAQAANGQARTGERGSAVSEFVLALAVLLPLVFGLIQVGLVAYVRTTLTAAASEGARAGAPLGTSTEDAENRARELADTTLAGRYAVDVEATHVLRSGVPVTAVTVRAEVPPLGLFGPAVPVDVTAHAVLQEAP